ncbi:hypothetical protein TL16_g10752 [Triparma laevis f. inornata]|uniref:Uncharacterized protein n=2 Tax=Triparma laevis TaxID=1534972 RepID=A0A9W7ABS7_9STRA|nr:hypothetical protein TrLO_g14699 [Triparma laevis f. longispina]GMH87105.1 hypothetical protein TL16_g10752 [Triparma laevis f. inornata]
MAMIPGVTDGVPALPSQKPSSPIAPESNLKVATDPDPSRRGNRTRPDQFWLEQSDTRDSWFGMRKAKSPKSASMGKGARLHGTRREKADKIKEEYLWKKVPGELVAQRGAEMAAREKKEQERKLIQQRKIRRKDLRVRMEHRRHQNHSRESKLGTTSRAPPPDPSEPVRVANQPIQVKDWRFYRRGDENLWTDFYHVPLKKLGTVIPPIALKKDQEAIDKVYELLQEEDAAEEYKEIIKKTKIKTVQHRFQIQMTRNALKEDYVFRNAPKSRPQSAAAMRTGKKFGKDVGGRSRPTSAMPAMTKVVDEERSLREHTDQFGFAVDEEENPRTEYEGSQQKTRPKSAPTNRRNEVIERLAKPKPLVKKFELAKHSGCAELKGMLLCDRALTEQLAMANLGGKKVAASVGGGKPGVRSGPAPTTEIPKPSTAQQQLLSSPVNTPLRGERPNTQQSTTLTEGSGSQVRFAGLDPEIAEAKKDQEKFEKKMYSNVERWEQEGQGLYSNPLSIYE